MFHSHYLEFFASLCTGIPLIHESCDESKTDIDKTKDRQKEKENGERSPYKEGGIRVMRTATASLLLPQSKSISTSSSKHLSSTPSSSSSAAAAVSSSSSPSSNTSTTRPMLCGHCNVQVFIAICTYWYNWYQHTIVYYSIVQYSAVQYSTVQCTIAYYSIVQYSIL